MERKSSKLQQHQSQELETQRQIQAKPAAKAFDTVEEVLRYDAVHTPPPEQLQQRLAKSIEREAGPFQPWWRRWLGKKEPR